MKQAPKKNYNTLPPVSEEIRLHPARGSKGFLGIMLLCALLVACLAAVGVWMQEGGSPLPIPGTTAVATKGAAPAPDSPPATGIPIVTMDLSRPDLGEAYIHNQSPYLPDTDALREERLSFFSADGKVLIIHTHASEGYLETSLSNMPGAIGDATYTRDPHRNVLSVGEELCRVLNEKGITAIHCTVMPDEPTLNGSYERAAEAVRRIMAEDPTIALVIDLHRDAVLTQDGSYVRSLTPGEGEGMAQVMMVVGSDGAGTPHPTWQTNLALALQLREKLQAAAPGICRPVSLRTSSYNQELAPAWLLLEVGTGANTAEEAGRAAQAVGSALAELLKDQA